MMGAVLSKDNEEYYDNLKIGEEAPYFCLAGTDDLIHSLSDYSSSKCLVVIFTGNHCPYAKKYEDRLSKLYNEFKPLGVEFVAICSNDGVAFPEDSFLNMKLKNFPYPYLHDESQNVAKAFGAQTTPEVFVFDSNFILRYHGAIDNNPDEMEKETAAFLENAISSILNGLEIKTPETNFIGCSIKYKV